MLRPLTLIILAASILMLSACDGEEPETPNLPTSVPVYTASPGTAAISESEIAVSPATDGVEVTETPTPEPLANEKKDEAATSSAQTADESTPTDTAPTEVVSGPEATPTDSEPSETENAAEVAKLTATAIVTGTDTTGDDTVVDAESTAAGVAVGSSAALSTTEPITSASIESDSEIVDAEVTDGAIGESESTATGKEASTAIEPESETEAVESLAAAETEIAGGDEDDIYAGLPASIAALMAEADPVRGEQLTLQNGCIGCHNLDPDVPMAGPTWYGLAETAASRIDGESAASYLYNSIVNTNDYIVEGYAANIMLQTYGETLSDQDLSDLLAYLLTLEVEQ